MMAVVIAVVIAVVMAMLVKIMVMIMVMIMAVGMVVVVVIVMRIGGPGRRAGMGTVMGTVMGLERCLDGDDFRARGLQQFFELRFAAQAQAVGYYFDRHVAIAESPGEPGERHGIRDAYLKQRLGLRHHLDEAAVIEEERIVMAQANRLGEVELDAGAVDAK